MPPANCRDLGDAGFPGLSIPEDFGGWRISGFKKFASLAGYCDCCTIVCTEVFDGVEPPIDRRMYATKRVAVSKMHARLASIRALWWQAFSEAKDMPTKAEVLLMYAARYNVMKGAQLALAGGIGFPAGPALMARDVVQVQGHVPRAPDDVWSVVRDFCGAWHPWIATLREEKGPKGAWVCAFAVRGEDTVYRPTFPTATGCWAIRIGRKSVTAMPMMPASP